MAQPEQDTKTPPFGPWVTFKNFIAADLKAKGIPDVIDSSLFRGKSGTDARHLRGSLRFLLLSNAAGHPNDALKHLVEAYGTPEWSNKLYMVLGASYGDILNGVNLQAASQGQLEEAFRTRGGVTGSTLRKAVRFYLAAAKESGLDLSPHFTSVRVGSASTDTGDGNGEEKPASAAAGVGQKKRKVRRSSNSNEDTSHEATPPDGVQAVFPLPRRDFRMWIPNDLTDDELAFAVTYLKNFVKLTRGKKP